MAEAELSQSRRRAEQTVLLAEAASRQKELEGRGESRRVMQVGRGEAAVQLKTIASYGDPRPYALAEVAGALSASSEPLVPERLFVAGAGGPGNAGGAGEGAQGIVGTLLALLVAEKSGLAPAGVGPEDPLARFADAMSARVIDTLSATEGAEVPKPGA